MREHQRQSSRWIERSPTADRFIEDLFTFDGI